jgi:hypothetical protein
MEKTHGKDPLCRSPERKRTAKMVAHGKLGFPVVPPSRLSEFYTLWLKTIRAQGGMCVVKHLHVLVCWPAAREPRLYVSIKTKKNMCLCLLNGYGDHGHVSA